MGREHGPRVACLFWPWIQNLPVEDRGEGICMPRCFFLQEAKFLGQKRFAYQDPTGEGAWDMSGHEAVSGRIGDLSWELKWGKERESFWSWRGRRKFLCWEGSFKPFREEGSSSILSNLYQKVPICVCCLQSLYQVPFQPASFPPVPFKGAFKQTMHQLLSLSCQLFAKQHESSLPPLPSTGQNTQAIVATSFSLSG